MNNTALQRFRDELFPAPPTEEGGAPTEEFLRALAEGSGSTSDQRFASHFALGNMYLRRGSHAESLTEFAHAIALNGDHAGLRLNHAVALLRAERFEEAVLELRRSLLLDSQLKLAHLYLGRILAGRDPESAREHLARFLEARPTDVEARLIVAQLFVESGDQAAARAAYEQLLQSAPDNFIAQSELAYLSFVEGERLFRAGEREAAFLLWGQCYRRYSRPFVSDQRIAQGMRALTVEFVDGNGLEKELLRFQEQFRKSPNDRSPFYSLVAHFLFSVGLIPEAYEEADQLEQEEARWERSLETRGEHPYPHFRLALIQFYRGALDAALLELSICRDRFPPKKQQALRIKDLFSFHDHLREIERKKGEYLNFNLSDAEWERAGFGDVFVRRAWKETGLAPEEAGQWLSSGFSAAKASLWAKWQIAPLDASRWLLHNFDSPQEVKLWMRGGFEPQEARVWAERCPLPLESVIQFRKVGFEDADLAYRWSAVLQLPVEAARWHELGFTPDETQEWRELGFFEAHQAYDWKQRGFTPASALREFNS